MNSRDTNECLREAVNDLITQGWPKTNVGKTLLGDNGQGHVNHWLKKEGGKINDFGIKPLNNIASQIGYDLHLVFLPKEVDSKLVNNLNEYNIEFVKKLTDAIVKYLSNAVTAPKFINRESGKNKIDEVLDSMLGITRPNPKQSDSDDDL